MKIALRATGIMSDYLPAGSVRARCAFELAPGATFAELAALLAIPTDQPYVVSINEHLIPEPQAHALAEGDAVVIMAPLAAG